MATKIVLSDEDKNKSMEYATSVMSTIDYSDRGQEDRKKIMTDHYVGKLGEIAVRRVLESEGKPVVGPDFEIHTNKSWDDDLFVDGVGIAVKTQTKDSAKHYGLSWTFHIKDPILKNKTKIIYFVEYTPTAMFVSK